MSALPADFSPLWLSLRSAAAAVALVAPLGVLTARLVRRWSGPRRTAADLLLLTPLVLPPTVLGFLLLQLLGRYGPIGGPLAGLGVEIVFSWPATVLSSALVAFPLLYRTALAALDQLDTVLEDVARSLGAGPGRVLRTVTLPLALPGLVAGISLGYARALGEFGTTLMLAGNIPGRTQTLPLALYAAVEAGDLRLAWWWTALVLGLNALCLLLVQGVTSAAARRPPSLPSAGPAAADAAEPIGALAVPPPFPLPATPRAPAAFQLEVALRCRQGEFLLDVDFVSTARRLAILGASGAGKSLLLRCLAGLERPAAGRIVLAGRPLFDGERRLELPPERRRIAVVVQHHALFPHLSVAANVGYGLAALPPRRRRALVGEQLRAVGLEQLAGRLPHQLSGGQRQRVALARALATAPDLLLLDEPFSSQDAWLRHRLQEQMDELLTRSGVPAILVTHDRDEAYRLCEELLVLEDGRLLAQGPRRQVFERPGCRAVARLTGCRNLSRARRRSPTELLALDWGLMLQLPEPTQSPVNHVGLRASQLRLLPAACPAGAAAERNRWCCRVVAVREGALHVSVLVLPEAPAAGAAAVLRPVQVDLRRQEWAELAAGPPPYQLVIEAGLILPLR